jgi:hypothetical protein
MLQASTGNPRVYTDIEEEVEAERGLTVKRRNPARRPGRSRPGSPLPVPP